MKGLHPNSLTIPRSELARFLGSESYADECAAELVPVRKRKRCHIFDREEVCAWHRAKRAERPAR